MPITFPTRLEQSGTLDATALFLAPVAFTLTALAMLTSNRAYYQWIIREDGPVEWLTVLAYAIAAIVALIAVTRLWRVGEAALSVLFAVFVLGMVFIAGEEASWGQRVFGFETPEELARVNKKNEFNVHNLEFFPVQRLFLCVALYGALGRALLGPFFAWIGPHWRNLLTVPPVLFFYFAIPAALFLYFEIVSLTVDFPEGMHLGTYLETKFISGKEQEPIEFLLGCGFLFFAIHAVRWTRQADARG